MGANPGPAVVPEAPLPGRLNCFIGRDPAKWRTGLVTYARVRYRDLYPRIDLLYYLQGRRLEFDLVLRPGARPRQVRMALEGTERPAIDRHGALCLTGGLRLETPFAYQSTGGERRAVRSGYRIGADVGASGERRADGRRHSTLLALDLGSYDRTHALTVDPVLTYSTRFEGGDNYEFGALAVDGSGGVYVSGSLYTPDPVLDSSAVPQDDARFVAFVSKFDPVAHRLVYTTLLGGGRDTLGTGVAVDPVGQACIAGGTKAHDLPTVHAFQSALRGGEDAFVARVLRQCVRACEKIGSPALLVKLRSLPCPRIDSLRGPGCLKFYCALTQGQVPGLGAARTKLSRTSAA